MNRFFNNTLRGCLLVSLPLAMSLPGAAQAQMVPEGGGMKQELADKGFNFRLYGKFRPKVTFGDDKYGESETDIRDDSSRVGIQGKIPISDGLHAVLRGEWKVGIQNGGDFGDVRLAFAGLESKDAGFLGIGTQWNPYYDIAAVPVDALYNASDTPVGYNAVGSPFRNDNFIKYNNSIGVFKVSAGIQADGSGNNADSVDAFAIGAGFDFGRGYIGVAYWQQNMDDSVPRITITPATPATFNVSGASTVTVPESEVVQHTDGNFYRIANPNANPARSVAVPVDGMPAMPAITTTTPNVFDEQRTFVGIGASFNITEDLYVAALYQDVEIDHDNDSDGIDRDRDALDIAVVHSFGHGMKLLAGGFAYDLDTGDAGEVKGVTLGLAKKLAPGLDVYVDWLREDPDAGDARNRVNFGVRYNFDVGLL